MKNSQDAAIRSWRMLGFYYSYDADKSAWQLVGDKESLVGFSNLLREYAANPKNARMSEHCHLGPYMLLEIMTAPKPKITSHAIAGSPDDLIRLSELIEQRVSSSKPGDRFTIGAEYSVDSESLLECQIEEAGFDPSTVDPFIIDTKGT
jgi:hypothetical protein